MRQLVALGPGQLEWQEATAPELTRATDALVRPVVVALCDADVSYLRGKLPPRAPFCFGHEFVADVVALGEEVRGFTKGDRVVVSFLIACGTCKRCQQGYPAACLAVPRNSAYGFGIFGDWGGAFCDLIRVPYAATMMARLPAGVSATDAASVGDNLSDGFRCVADGLAEEPGAPVLIAAGGGGVPSISLYAAVLAVALGSTKVDFLDSDPARLALAHRLGANPIEVKRPPKRHGSYWVTADTSGDPSGAWLGAALNSTAPYGRCTSCGVYHAPAPVPLGGMFMRGVRFTIGWANVQALMPKVLGLLADKQVALDHVHTIAPWDDAISAMRERPLKLIVARPEAMDAGTG
jgi:alcohol dehydrogenase